MFWEGCATYLRVSGIVSDEVIERWKFGDRVGIQNPCKIPPQLNLVTLKGDAACFPQRRNKFSIFYVKMNQKTTISKHPLWTLK